MSSSIETETLYHRFLNNPFTIAVGSRVVDVRGLRGFTVILDGGTASYQPCDAGGTVIPGSTSTAAVSETLVAAAWPFYLVTAVTAACVAATVG